MGKSKSAKADAATNGSTDADLQRSTDLVIAPEKKTQRLDTSKWPLLLKVCSSRDAALLHS